MSNPNNGPQRGSRMSQRKNIGTIRVPISHLMFRTLEHAQSHLTMEGIDVAKIGGPPTGYEEASLDRDLALFLHRNCFMGQDWKGLVGTYLSLMGQDPMVFGYKIAGRNPYFRFEQKLWREGRSKRLASLPRRHEGDWFLLEVIVKDDLNYYEAAFEASRCQLVFDSGEELLRCSGDLPEPMIGWALLSADLVVKPDPIEPSD